VVVEDGEVNEVAIAHHHHQAKRDGLAWAVREYK
jgi:hypothetical protein